LVVGADRFCIGIAGDEIGVIALNGQVIGGKWFGFCLDALHLGPAAIIIQQTIARFKIGGIDL